MTEKKKVQIVVDLGNSQTRAVARCGFEAGKVLHKTFELDNTFAPVEDDYELDEMLEGGEYDDKNSFAVEVALEELVPNLEGIVVGGVLAERNYGKSIVRPRSERPKYDNWMVYLALINVIDKTIQWLNTYSTSTRKTKTDVTRSFDFDLTVLVPPLQQKEGTKVFVDNLMTKGLSYVDYFTKEQVKINVTSVDVKPEGMSAFLAHLYSYETLKPREIAAELLDKKILVLDIGAGTTDILAIDKGKLVESSRTTIKLGGNDIISRTRNKYNVRNKTNLSEPVFRDVLVKPEIGIGDTVVNIVKLVESSKREVSRQLINEITSFFEAQNIDLKTFNLLLVVGGGALSNGESKALSELIYKGVLDYIPEIRLLEEGLVKEPLLYEGALDLTTLRTLNLLGALTARALQTATTK
jgi:hypothetical protein